MGTVMAIMAGYYILNGQAFRALGDATKWLQENLPQEGQEKNDTAQ